jgi:hypothetical protein
VVTICLICHQKSRVFAKVFLIISNFLILSTSDANKVKGLSLRSVKYFNISGSPVFIKKSVIFGGRRLQRAINWHTLAFVIPATAARSSYVALGLSFRYSMNLKPVRTGFGGSGFCCNEHCQFFFVMALLAGK